MLLLFLGILLMKKVLSKLPNWWCPLFLFYINKRESNASNAPKMKIIPPTRYSLDLEKK